MPAKNRAKKYFSPSCEYARPGAKNRLIFAKPTNQFVIGGKKSRLVSEMRGYYICSAEGVRAGLCACGSCEKMEISASSRASRNLRHFSPKGICAIFA